MVVNQLIKLLQSISPLDNSDVELLSSYLKHESVKAETKIINIGEVADKLIYLQKGLCISCSIDSNNQINIHDFHGAGEIISDFDSFFSQNPANTCIVAIEDTEFCYLTFADRQKIIGSSIKLALMTSKLNEILYIKTKTRYEKLIKMSLQERYLMLLNSKPDLFQRVPLKYIAEYLKVRPQSLSRIRKSILNKRQSASYSTDNNSVPEELPAQKPTKS
jgi:CRP-like cAMP-binding protein